MPLNETALNTAVDALRSAITHIGLTNGAGTELTGGSYARQAVTWTAASAGDTSPTADLTFDVPGGSTVGAWQGYSALTAGTGYGEIDLTDEVYAGDGQYVLEAASTGLDIDAV